MVTAEPPAAAPPRLSVRRVIGATFGVWWRHLGFFLLWSVVFSVPTALPGILSPLPEVSSAPLEVVVLLLAVVVVIVAIVAQFAVQAGAIEAALLAFAGERPGFATVLVALIPKILPFSVVVLLFSLAAGLGFLLFVVPGVVLAVVFAVVGPALIAERPGIVGAFRRSRRLTRGHRWRILALLVASVALPLAALTALSLFLWVWGFVAGQPADGFMELLALALLVASTPLLPVGSAALYDELTALERTASGEAAHR